MTLDERLEALTQSVELLAAMHRDNETRYAEMFKRSDERAAILEQRTIELMDTMNRLGRILEIHDRQLDDHGKRLDDLE